MEKSYYAIIPATVRYNKKIPSGAKLLYGEITALCNEKGFCWASNQYFADLYDISASTIKRWISELENNGYVIRNYRYKDGTKEVEARCITICDTSVQKYAEVGAEMNRPPVQKCDAPRCKNEPENNTVNNTVNNTMNISLGADEPPREKRDKFIEPTVEEVDAYCRVKGYGIDPEEFVAFYQSKNWRIGKDKMSDWKAATRTWEIKRKKDNPQRKELPFFERHEYD